MEEEEYSQKVIAAASVIFLTFLVYIFRDRGKKKIAFSVLFFVVLFDG